MRIHSPPGSYEPDCHRTAPALISILVLLVSLVASPTHANTLDRITESGSIKLGYDPDARPISFQTQNGAADGYSVALCGEITQKIRVMLGLSKLSVELIPVTGATALQAVQDGTIDLLCSATTETLAARRQVSFSLPIFLSGVGALVRADAPKQLRAILAGEEPAYRPRWRASYGQILQRRTFSVHSGTTAAVWLNERIDEFDVQVKIAPVSTYQDGLQRVLKRQSDVLLGDRAILLDTAFRHPAANDLIVSPRQFTHEAIALALQRDDEDFRLLVDSALSSLYRTGEIMNLYRNYFGEPDQAALELFSWAALPD